MGIENKNPAEKEFEELTVDLSKQKLKKLDRATCEQQLATTLIVDDNELEKLNNVNYFSNLKKLSAANNQIIRTNPVSNLSNLEELNLSNNALVSIDGLKNLKLLKYLNLSKNKIRTLDSFHCEIGLEKLDLSENSITHITNLSYLKNLKALYLHHNKISHLKQCEKNLPKTLVILTISYNLIQDLNEISHLVNLCCLKELSIAGNPCVQFPENLEFNYRPFLKNWCCSISVVDDRQLNDIESLKAEWLYSQGRGRSFRIGEHGALIEYLHSVCPKEGEEDENDDVKKLKLILSKAQQHQKQLKEQISAGQIPVRDSPKNVLSKKKSAIAPERMTASFQEQPPKDINNSQETMSRSLNSDITKTFPFKSQQSETRQLPLETSTTFLPLPDTLISPDVVPTSACLGPPSASSRTSRSSSRNSLHSTPESKRKTPTRQIMKPSDNSSSIKPGNASSIKTTVGGSLRTRNTSPGKKGTGIREPTKHSKDTSEDEGSEIIALRLMAFQQRANQRKQILTQEEPKKGNVSEVSVDYDTDSPEWKAALCIQRRWRGYRTRNLNKDVLAACNNIQISRIQEYITKIMMDMEATRDALEKNRKLLHFHMQAIHGLWKKMTAMQPAVGGKGNEEKVSLQGLSETCENLNERVKTLQLLVETMGNSKADSNPMATQTDIIAVHIPQGDSNGIFFTRSSSADLVVSPLFAEDVPNTMEGDAENFRKDTSSVIQTEIEMRVMRVPSELHSETFQEKLTKPSMTFQNSEVCLPNEVEKTPKADQDEDTRNS